MNANIEQARLNNQLKNPTVALALGFFIPGAGQMYAGSTMWGVINLILFVILCISVIAAPLAFVVWVASLVLGFKGTKKYNDDILDAAEAGNQGA